MNKVLINGLLINNRNAGIGNYGYNLIKTLTNKVTDYDISVLSQLGITYNNVSTIYKSYNKSYNRILAEQLLLLTEYKKYDLLHFIDYSSPLININVPFIVTIHDLSYYKYPEAFTYGSRKIKEIIAPFSITKAAKIIADSENTKQDIVSMFNIEETKIKVIYPGKPDYKRVENGILIESIKKKYGIKGEYILYLGTLEPRKNILRLIDAYNLLLKQGITEKLVIAGKKGWLYEGIFKKVSSLGLTDKIIFTGFIDEKDKPLLYSGTKVFVYPSLYEGFGLPPLEAMTCGIPVVVSETSSLPEVVGECGLYVNPKDVNSIAKGIYDIITEEDLQKKLKLLGIDRSKTFSWHGAASKIIEVYDEIMR